MQTGVVTKNIREIKIIRWIANIIQADLNSGVRTVFGQKGGLAAEVLGMRQAVNLITTEGIQHIIN